MRRIALTLVLACGASVLAACSGGTGLSSGSSSSIAQITFTNGSAQADDFFVSPTGNAPLELNGIAYQSGFNHLIVPGVQFTWSATYAPVGTPYLRGPQPNGNGVCGSPAETTAVNSLLAPVTQKIGGSTPVGQPFGEPTPFYANFVQLTDANNPVGTTPDYFTNVPNYTQKEATVFVGPPLTLDANGLDTDEPVQPALGYTNYCLLLTATAGGATGTVVVVVSNSP